MGECLGNFDPEDKEEPEEQKDDSTEWDRAANEWFKEKMEEITNRRREQEQASETNIVLLEAEVEVLRSALKNKVKPKAEQASIDRTNIEQLIPHRRPFMFLESAEVIESGKRAVGVLADLREPDFDFLKSHFPGFQVVPGAILMEALAELLGIAVASGVEVDTNKVGVLVEDRMRYRKMVRPGDIVCLGAEVINMRRNIGRGNVRAIKDDKVVVEGEITFALIDRPN